MTPAKLLVLIAMLFPSLVLAQEPTTGEVSSSCECDEGPIILTDISVNILAALMRSWGYRAEVDETGNGTSVITSIVGGLPHVVALHAPTEDDPGAFRDIQIFSGFGKSVRGDCELVETWNSRHRFSYATVSSDGAMVLQVDASLRGGVTKEYLKQQMDRFEVHLRAFRAFVAKQ